MDSSRPHLFGVLAGVFLAAGIAFASLVLAGAWTRISESQLISVTGSARRSVRSDLVIWRTLFRGKRRSKYSRNSSANWRGWKWN
jgi:hypothetical protein